jgi:hypothetical protein
MRIVGPAILFAMTTASAAVGAPGPKDARKPTDPPSGDWEVLKWENNGRVVKEYKAHTSDMTMRFTPKKRIVVDRNFPGEERAEYYKNGEVFEIDLPDSGTRGIWKVEDDTLLLCFAWSGRDRPTDFTAARDSKRMLWTLKRKKE